MGIHPFYCVIHYEIPLVFIQEAHSQYWNHSIVHSVVLSNPVVLLSIDALLCGDRYGIDITIIPSTVMMFLFEDDLLVMMTT